MNLCVTDHGEERTREDTTIIVVVLTALCAHGTITATPAGGRPVLSVECQDQNPRRSGLRAEAVTDRSS